MKIILDPYFLDLEDEKEIKDNILFFQTLVFLCTSGKVSICLYKELINKISARNVTPFPIQLGKVYDDNLRGIIINLNEAFNHVIMKNIMPLDVEECGGNQNFAVISEHNDVSLQLEKDAKYYELLSVLLHSCYDKQVDLSKCIVTGHIKKGRKVGDKFKLICKCDKSFEENYIFDVIDKFVSNQDRAFRKLEELYREKVFFFVELPDIVRSAHHNKLQFNSGFTVFNGLSRINKSVLMLLRPFGLQKIIFGEFHRDTSRSVGTIVAYSIKKTYNTDIVKGWLYAETGFKNHVDLYFPESVGENLMLYLENDFSKNNVERLIDTLGLTMKNNP